MKHNEMWSIFFLQLKQMLNTMERNRLILKKIVCEAYLFWLIKKSLI